MINPENISVIVNRTLKRMGVYEVSLEKLIKGTFASESYLEELMDYSNEHVKKRGLMMLGDNRSAEILLDYLKFRRKEKEALEKACNVDITTTTIEERLQLLETNIAFMVAITFHVYSSQYEQPPADDLNEIAFFYTKYFDLDRKYDKEDFKETYKRLFLNK